MELRAGYKQTELGLIPEDWQIAPLGDHATFKTGPFGSALHQSDYVDGGVPVVNPMQIVDGKILPTSAMSVTEAAAQRLSDFRLSKGNIVIGRRGDMGRCACVRPEQHGWLCGTGSMIIRTGASLNAQFIQRVLASQPIIAEIENASVGSTMTNLNQGTLATLLVPLPSTKGEQEAIAEALGDADTLIESLERLLTKKHNLKQGAMQELLTGRRRLPEFGARLSYKHTEVGAVPEDWDVKTLGDLFTFQNGVNADKSAYGSGVAFINVLEVITYHTLTEARIPGRIRLSARVRGVFAVQFGDILFNRTSETQEELGLAAVYTGNNEVVFGGFVIRARPRASSIDPIFMSYVLRSPTVRAQIVARGQGAIRANIGQHDLARVQLPLPAKAEQRAIATVLSEMDAEIGALEAKLAKACRLKQGMMQQLLTGQTRLI